MNAPKIDISAVPTDDKDDDADNKNGDLNEVENQKM